MEKNLSDKVMSQPINPEIGRSVPEAHAAGVTWITVSFLKQMRIAWNWDDLLQDATAPEANLNLAMAGLVLSNDVEMTSKMGEKVLQQLGFEEISSEHYRFSTRTRNRVSKPARTFGHKLLEKDGKQYHVICAVFKGTTTLPDTITDAKSIVDGFFWGGKSCADSLGKYISRFEGANKDNTILFITGHSLGASTANVVGRLAREFARDESNFVYAFASPNYETNGEWNNGKSYPNFHYYTNANDVVPTVPPKMPPTFFSKIGTEHLFTYSAMGEEQKRRFLRAYTYFRGMTFEEDTDLLGLGLQQSEGLVYKALKNHLCHTYMSFLLSELTDEEIGNYLIE
ncbi:MAG: hypothetical protein J6M46_04990 [Lachnospiraceae bacterium]|nr:hypothetical protein [Lachnospiraceae bacterium]